jgi:hypothetical protein
MLTRLRAATSSQTSLADQLEETSCKLVKLRAPDIGVLFARMSLDLAPRSQAAVCGIAFSQALLASRRLEEALQAALQVGTISAADSFVWRYKSVVGDASGE